ncbi:hypothetical protein [Bizionia sp. M204]|uniref:hypothetical protein n=1 Tax=Bizionia sp. M204 TaxID=2675331 RepID=UPI002051D16E|nr:hypothetical protein [Bizionia sp. M204]UPS91230.1 hypothetical protein GMA17_05630 [Bizionia sp. M204]
MKRSIKTIVLFSLCFIALFSTIYAQQSINYKAIIKDDNGNVIANDVVPVQFNILQGVAQTNVYSELHTPTTDANGIIIVNIGEGILVGGSPDFNTIDWASDTHFLQVFVNIGDGLVDMGITEFNAVPYALSSGDKSWETEIDNVHVLSKNVGIGTDTPTELLEISDVNNAGIKLVVPTINNTSKIEFRNGLESGSYSFYKIENRSDVLRFELDSDLITTTGFESKMTLSNSGLALENGTRVNAFSSDGTLASNSNNALPTEQAVKTYVDNSIATLAPTAKTIVVPATTFTSNNSLVNFGIGGGYAYKPTGTQAILAPLVIPIGSTVTSVTFYFRDTNNAGGVNLIGDVIAYYRTNTSATIPVTVSTFGSSTTGMIEVSSNPFNIATDRQHYIRVRPSSNWDGSNLAIHSVKVTYTEN